MAAFVPSVLPHSQEASGWLGDSHVCKSSALSLEAGSLHSSLCTRAKVFLAPELNDTEAPLCSFYAIPPRSRCHSGRLISALFFLERHDLQGSLCAPVHGSGSFSMISNLSTPFWLELSRWAAAVEEAWPSVSTAWTTPASHPHPPASDTSAPFPLLPLLAGPTPAACQCLPRGPTCQIFSPEAARQRAGASGA